MPGSARDPTSPGDTDIFDSYPTPTSDDSAIWDEEAFAKWEADQADDKIEHCGLLVEHLENGDTEGNSDDEPYSEAWLYSGDPDVNTPDSNPYDVEYDSDAPRL